MSETRQGVGDSRQGTSDVDGMCLDYILVADAADVVGGKLFVLGGGWSHLMVGRLPGPSIPPFFVAAGVGVPWSATERRFRFVIDVLDEDGASVDEVLAGSFEMKRPLAAKPGARQRMNLAAPVMTRFPGAGRYRLRLRVDGEVFGETAIQVSEHPA